MSTVYINRRNFVVLSGSALLSGCQATTASDSLSQSVARRNQTLQAAIIVGAGLGFAVAQARGGSALTGLVVGAFVGATAHAALNYARTLLKNNENDLTRSYIALGDNAISDARTFLAENAPAIEERSAIVDAIKQGSRSVNLSNIETKLRDLAELEKRRTIPTPAYAQAAEIYPPCTNILPQAAGVAPQKTGEQQYAWNASKENLKITTQYSLKNAQSFRDLKALGIRLT